MTCIRPEHRLPGFVRLSSVFLKSVSAGGGGAYVANQHKPPPWLRELRFVAVNEFRCARVDTRVHPQIKKYHQMEAKITQDDPILAKLNKVPIQISLGDMRLLRETVIMKWKDINRSYQGPLLGDTVLHRVCREG